MNESERKFQKDLNAGLTALVLLGVLADSGEDLYGYEIAKQLARAGNGESRFKEGTIYPVLRALAASGHLDSRIEPSAAGPPRRYYRITPQGRTTLTEWGSIWRQTKNFVDQFVKEDLQ
jgi:PadR family transcriptional regulator, regulatory protein PadR